MIGLDSNVMVRYLVEDDPAQTARAKSVIDALTASAPGFIATVTWAEMYWVLTRTYGFTRAEVVDKLASLVESEEIQAENPTAIAAAVSRARQGADFADALIDAAARRAGCSQVVTFDKRAASKLGWQSL